MHILYLTSAFPYPLLAGHLRYYHFMRELAQRHRVTLLSLRGRDFEPAHEAAVASIVDRVQTFERRDERSPLGRFLKEDARLLSKLDPGMRELEAAARQTVAEDGVDVVVLAGKRVLPAAASLRVPIVADVCDAESIRFRTRLSEARGWEAGRVWVGWKGLQFLESRVVHRADRVLFASKRDRDAVPDVGDGKGVIVPNGVDTNFWRRDSDRLGERTIVFTGAMHYRPNADAALRLAREIFPGVQDALPEARLLLVGRDPSPELQEAGRRPGVTVTGFVDDVRPFLSAATVFAGPLRYASGIQNKILEAMAMQLPVIASGAAADGLRTRSGDSPPLETAETTEEFVRAITASLKRETGGAPHHDGRRFVEQHFSWPSHSATLERALEEAVAVHRR